MAQSRLKTIEKMEKEGPEAPVEIQQVKAHLKLPSPPVGTRKDLLWLKSADIGWYNTAQQREETVLRNVNLHFERGQKIAVRGANGAGKSTLMSAISGRLPLTKGERVEGENLALGVFTQDLAQDLDQTMRAVDVVTSTVRAYDPTLSDEKARSVLGALGLRQEKAMRLVGHLSGGEKARVALASFVLIPHNFLLLDEPSNHLDVETVEVLVDALKKFQGGSILVISHDKKFLETFEPSHVLTVKGGSATLEERSLTESDWCDDLNARANESKFIEKKTIKAEVETLGKDQASKDKKVAKKIVKMDESLTDEERKKKLNAPRRIKKLEDNIAKCQGDLEKIAADMLKHGRDIDKLKELQQKSDEIEEKNGKFYAEMEDLLEYV